MFKDIDLVEQLGSGMSRILHAYDTSIFDISDNFIKVIFPFIESLNEDSSVNGNINGNINEIEKEVLKIIAQNPTITLDQMGRKLGKSKRSISRSIKELRDSGKITRVGSNKKGHWEIKDVDSESH